MAYLPVVYSLLLNYDFVYSYSYLCRIFVTTKLLIFIIFFNRPADG